MKTTIFKSIVKKGNNKGVGFISIPKEKRQSFTKNEQLEIIINSRIKFYSKIKFYGTLGFYVPLPVMNKNNLVGSEVKVKLKPRYGFYTRIGSDGRIYIPQHLGKKYTLKSKDIVEIEIELEKETIQICCQVHYRQKKNGEYLCYLGIKKYNQYGILRLKRKLQKFNHHSSRMLNNLLKDFNSGIIDNSKIISYYGNRMPILINPTIKIENLAYYLGSYFADGTKRGTHWGICASTFIQAVFFKQMHEEIIKDPRIVFSITYCNAKEYKSGVLERKLVKKWEQNTNIDLSGISVRILPVKNERSPNRNPYGSLIFKENRELTRIYYVKLLNFLIEKIYKEKNKRLALDFILGVLDGDGSVSSKKRGHVIITSNPTELATLEKIMAITGLNFKKYLEGKNKGYIRLWSLDIIFKISLLKDKLFKYYPKRRKILQKRLGNTGCAKFLLGKSKKTSNVLLGRLKKEGILDHAGYLTKTGTRIKKDLKAFLTS